MRVWVSLSPFKEKKNVRVGVNFNLLRLLKKLEERMAVLETERKKHAEDR